MVEEALVHIEFTRVDSTLGQAVLSGAFGSKLIYLYGSEDQKRRYLPRVLNGDAVMYAAFTEPGHGSDITRLSTRVTRRGERWIINGSKTFITNAPIADFGIILCQGEYAGDKPYRHQYMFIVENDMQGVKVREMKGKMGQRGSPIGEIILNNVEVGDDALLGEEGRGFYQALTFFNHGRVRAASNGIGMALGAIDRAIKYAGDRVQFDRRIIEFQAVSHKIAVMIQYIEAAKLLTLRAAWMIDRGLDPRMVSVASAIAKRYSSEAASWIADQAIQIHGGYGYMSDIDLERRYRDIRVLRIYEGTSEILNEVIIGGVARGDYPI